MATNQADQQNSHEEKTTTYDIDDLTNEQSAGGELQEGSAFDTIRGSVVGVLESVVREYEPQIQEFTANIAHQAVDRGVEFAQTAGARIKSQSWLRLGVAAALGIAAVAVITYEAIEAADASESTGTRRRRPVH